MPTSCQYDINAMQPNFQCLPNCLAMSSAAEHSGLDNRLALVVQRPGLPINIHLQQIIPLISLSISQSRILYFYNAIWLPVQASCRYIAVTVIHACQKNTTTTTLRLLKCYTLSNTKGTSRHGHGRLSQGMRRPSCMLDIFKAIKAGHTGTCSFLT